MSEPTLAEEHTAPRPPWGRLCAYAFGLTVGASSLAASGFDLFGLARALGFPLGTCIAVPVGFDAGAVACAVLWVTSPPSSAERTRWRNATLGMIGGSAVLNGLSVLAAPHWLANAIGLDGTRLPVRDVGLVPGGSAVLIAFVVAVAFPLIAAFMIHAVLSVRDAAARHHQPRARFVLLRRAAGSLSLWLRARAYERWQRRQERHAMDMREREAALALPASPSAREEREDEEETREPQHAREEEPEEEDTGELPALEPTPPALTGHKMNDAQAFYRWCREQGRTPKPVDVNDRIDSSGYVKTRHVDAWEAEWRGERVNGHHVLGTSGC